MNNRLIIIILVQAPSNIDRNKLMTIITDLVHKDQYQLHLELERRRHMLQFDAKYHRFCTGIHNGT
jgi:hypothetical protein